jgi:hypothetical protein
MKKKTINAELKRIEQQVRAEYGASFSRAIGNESDLTDDFGAVLDFATLDRPAKDQAYVTFKKLLDASPAKAAARADMADIDRTAQVATVSTAQSPELIFEGTDPLRYPKEIKANLATLPPLDTLPDGPPKNIFDVCRRVVWVTGVERFVFRANTQRKWKKTQFNSEYNRFLSKGVSIADDLFKEGNLLRTLPDIGYIPGSGEIVGETYNLWRPSPIVPVEGDVALWDAHMFWLFPDEGQRKRLLDWLAWVYQNQGERPCIALLIIGMPGTGKSAIARIFEQIIGVDNTARPKNSSLTGEFNAWAAECKLAVFEELYQSGRLDVVNAMHTLITEARFEINIKGISAYKIRSYLACLGLSNFPDALPLGQFDRRWQVEHSPVTRAELLAQKQTDHFARIMPLLNALDNDPNKPAQPETLREALRLASAVAYQLQQRVVTAEDFTPGEAKVTSAKIEMIELGRKSLDRWLSQQDFESRELLNLRADLIERVPLDIMRETKNVESVIEKYLKGNLDGVWIDKHRVKIHIKGKSSSVGLWAINALGVVAKRRIKAGSTPRDSVGAVDIPAKYLAERVAAELDAEPPAADPAEAKADFEE